MNEPTKSSLIKDYKKPPQKTEAATAKPLSLNDRFKVLMSSRSWELLMALVNWAIVYEKMSNNEPVEFTEEVRAVLMAPFTLFGTNMQLYTALSGHLVPVLMHNMMQYESDPVYKSANPMPWLVLQSAAPLMAQNDFGTDAMRECVSVMMEMKELQELPT